MITIICAIAKNGAIGYQNRLLYHLRADLQRFKELTSGHTVIMGRRTFESLPKGALPNRRNIVLSRSAGFSPARAEVFPSLREALSACSRDEDIYIIGGASVYAKALPLADRLCLTHIHATPPQADTFFPETDWTEWQKVSSELHDADEHNEVPYTFADYVRISEVEDE